MWMRGAGPRMTDKGDLALYKGRARGRGLKSPDSGSGEAEYGSVILKRNKEKRWWAM
ncbi:protein of unknown function [Magnetospirillum sp. XM-1]|nr:protein of unknown function [Magnetospirillum sp. XM-1]